VTVPARAVGASRNALRSVSLMCRCQPAPRLRKCLMTSGSSRIETSCLVGAFCGPRRRRYAATISGTTSTAGRMRAKSSSFSSELSGSRAIPALISASSSGRGRKTLPNPLSLTDFAIAPDLTFVRFAQRNDVPHSAAKGEDQDMQSAADLAVGDVSLLALIAAYVLAGDCAPPVKIVCRCKVDLVALDVELTLCFVPRVEARRHAVVRSRDLFSSQANCKYNLQMKALP
jgi:hypothetical protein